MAHNQAPAQVNSSRTNQPYIASEYYGGTGLAQPSGYAPGQLYSPGGYASSRSSAQPAGLGSLNALQQQQFAQQPYGQEQYGQQYAQQYYQQPYGLQYLQEQELYGAQQEYGQLYGAQQLQYQFGARPSPSAGSVVTAIEQTPAGTVIRIGNTAECTSQQLRAAPESIYYS